MIGVLTTVYPSARKWIPDFLASLQAQTRQPDIIYCANDGADDLVALIKQCYARVVEVPGTGSPGQIRKHALLHLCRDGLCEFIVGCDIDDRQSPNRIEASIQAHRLSGAPVVFSDLSEWDAADPLPVAGAPMKWHGRFPACEPMAAASLTSQGNCLGLGNTSFAPGIMENAAGLAPVAAKAYDWGLFSLLDDGVVAAFQPATHVHYRRHQDSLAIFQPGNASELHHAGAVISELYGLIPGNRPRWERLHEHVQNIAAHSGDGWLWHLSHSRPIAHPLWWELGI